MPQIRILFSILFLATLWDYTSSDVDSGCPGWGCLPSGSFSLSSKLPGTKGKVKWSVVIDNLDNDDDFRGRGCVSDQVEVVCATKRGYVGLDPLTGKILWKANTTSPPYLPVMDIYGDIIGMDKNNLYSVKSNGESQKPISIADLSPNYALMISNNSILFLTSSNSSTNQIVTYGPSGIVGGAILLRDTIQGVNGTFVPSSQPVINGARAYVMTYFIPDNVTTFQDGDVISMQRLYAIDVYERVTERIVIAWYFNLGAEDEQLPNQHRKRQKTNGENDQGKNTYGENTRDPSNVIPSIVVYFNGTVYINIAGYEYSVKDLKPRQKQPLQSMLWAVRDKGSKPELLFRNDCFYGPMAVYENYTSNPKDPLHEERAIWVMNPSPGMVIGHSTRTGNVIASLDIPGLYLWFSSKLGITRLASAPEASRNNDVLVMGGVDGHMNAQLVAVEMDLKNKTHNAKLLWSTMLNHPQGSEDGDTSWVVDGQIVNYVSTSGRLSFCRRNTWEAGLIVTVSEHNYKSRNSTVHVFGVF